MSDGDDTTSERDAAGDDHGDLTSAVTDFRNALEAAWPSADAQAKVIEAYEQYTAILSEAWRSPEVSRRASETYAAYAQSVREAFQEPDARKRMLDAYRSFVDDLKRAWQGVDPSTMTPGHLASMAEGMSWVAGVAGEISRAAGRSE